MPVWLYRIIPPREDFALTLSAEEAGAMSAHFDYLKSLHAKGMLKLTGRTESGSIGLSIFEAEDLAAAQAVAENDPAKQAGVIDIVVELFRIVEF